MFFHNRKFCDKKKRWTRPPFLSNLPHYKGTSTEIVPPKYSKIDLEAGTVTGAISHNDRLGAH